MPAPLISFEVTGARDVLGRFTALDESMREGRRDAAEDAASTILIALESACPVWSGDLRDALDSEVVEGPNNTTHVRFFVDDSPSSIPGKVSPAVYVDWVIHGRGAVVPVNAPWLVFPLDPSGGDTIITQRSGPTQPNDFPQRVANASDNLLVLAVRKWAARVKRVLPGAG